MEGLIALTAKKLTPREKKLKKVRLEKYHSKDKVRKIKKYTLITLISAVSVAAIAGIIFGVITLINNSGAVLRKTVSFSSDNYEIDNAMFSYYYYDTYYSLLSQYYDNYYAEKGLDTSKSLRSQQYSDIETWFEYFIGIASDNAEELMMFLEVAKADGTVLDADDYADIDKDIATLQSNADEKKISLDKYIAANYGTGVKEDDVYRMLEYIALSHKQYIKIYSTLDYTEDEVNAYYDENSTFFQYSDFISYTFTPDVAEDETDTAVIQEASDAAKAQADELSKCGTAKEFSAWIKDYLSQTYSGDELQKKIDDTVSTKYAYETDSSFSKWVFSGMRKDGDCTVIAGDNGEYTAIYIVKAMYKDDSESRNVRHILFSFDNYDTEADAKAAADAVYTEWNSSGKTEEDFIALADKYNEDDSTKDSSGYMKNVFADTTDTEFDSWCFDSTRKTGDVGMVKTQYGYHLIYFVGEGYKAWQSSAESYMKSSDYNTLYQKYQDKYVIETNIKYAKRILDLANS